MRLIWLNNGFICKELYDLRSVNTGAITNIGSFARLYPYKETDFYEFDKFLFTTWSDRHDSRNKEQLDFGDF